MENVSGESSFTASGVACVMGVLSICLSQPNTNNSHLFRAACLFSSMLVRDSSDTSLHCSLILFPASFASPIFRGRVLPRFEAVHLFKKPTYFLERYFSRLLGPHRL